VFEDVEQIGTADLCEPMILVMTAVAGIAPPVAGEKVDIRLTCLHVCQYRTMVLLPDPELSYRLTPIPQGWWRISRTICQPVSAIRETEYRLLRSTGPNDFTGISSGDREQSRLKPAMNAP
jgi:hypothetical protein